MSIVLSFAHALQAKQKEVQAALLRKNLNDDLIARFRLKQKAKIAIVDTTCDLRAMREIVDKPPLGLVHHRTDEDVPPPAC